MCVTSESDEKIMPNNDVDSPATDDAESESITTIGESSRLKKGPWTAAEDAILVEYVTRKGEGNWNAVQRHTGLARCGKSCRLRWANHLRPDLKKGAFTEEEEKLIVELHAKLGNKWARMAAEMPGRTDNEIKNYWNTRIKRRQRAGLPLYPPELRLQTLNENQHDTMSSLSSDSREAALPVNNFEIPSIQFKNLELNQPVYPPPFLDLPTNNFPLHGLHSSYPEKFELPIIHPPKRLRGSEPLFPNHTHSLTFNHSQPPFTYYDPHGLTFNNNHADLNGNPSSSSSKEEQLPSLQTQIQKWCSSSPHLPSLESCDNLIRTPPVLSHQLDAMNMMHGSQNMTNFKNSSNDSGMVFNYASSELINEAGWEPYGELTSSLGHSSSSMFSDGIATPISRNSISEHEGVEGFRANEELPIWAPSQHTTGWEDLPIPSDYYTREKQP